MKFFFRHIVLVLCLLAFSGGNLFGQILLKETSLEKQIKNSSLVIEGKVLSKRSFWDAENKNIYTANTVEVYKVFKGEPLETIEIITEGGTVGNLAQMVVPSLKLREGDFGVLTLYGNDIRFSDTNKSDKKQFKVYSSVQGFYKYDLKNNHVANPFRQLKGISNSFYDEIKRITKSNYIEISNFNVEKLTTELNQRKNILVPSAITFSPTTVTAGTKSTITITIPSGASRDFGSNKGKVSFSDADLGGDGNFIEALDSQVIAWSNNSITVQLPSDAGTGKIKVTDFGGNSIISSTDLTVPYSIINFVNAGNAYIPQHYNKNLTGGYTWKMYTGFNANVNANFGWQFLKFEF